MKGIADLKQIEATAVQLPDRLTLMFQDEEWLPQYQKVRSTADLNNFQRYRLMFAP
jgi:hypothetical protein